MHRAHSSTDRVGVTEATPTPDARTATISQLGATRDPAEVEHLADELARVGADRWTGSVRGDLIEALVLCLTGDSIRQDADAEDAICSALGQLGVMRRAGNLVFEFLPDDELAPSDLVAIPRYRGWLPGKYTIGRPTAGNGTDVRAGREWEVTPWSME